MKKIVKLTLVIMMILVITGCGCSKKEVSEPKDVKFGDTITIKGFKIELVNYSIRSAATTTEKYSQVIYIEVNVTNTSTRASAFSDSVYNAFGPDNILLTKVTATSYPTMISKLGSIRSNGTTNGHIIIPFVGYGEYIIEFTTISGKRLFKFNVYE